ncbi:MAG TPA: M28 family peptidase [Pyrinomonadaceae bacterium]|nr:M28 family peptidase [Pyrinomonadaceae bacterium]
MIAIALFAGCALLLFARSVKVSGKLISSSGATPTAYQNPELVRRYQRTITPGHLASRLYFLASDLFEGRETSTRGQKLAAYYLASQFRAMGLAPKGTVKTDDPFSLSAYLQPFNVYKRLPEEGQLEVKVDGNTVATSAFSLGAYDDLAYFAFGAPVGTSGGVVFAGYGIADDRLGYNDYAALAVKGVPIDNKWVMILADEPLSDDSTSRLPTVDHKPSEWTTQIQSKLRAILKAGRPKGLLIISDAGPRGRGRFAENAARASLDAKRVGSPLWLYQTPPTSFPPSYMISTRLANQILSSSGQRIEDLVQEINRTLQPVVFDVRGVEVSTRLRRFEALETENVLALIEGSDPKLKDEVLIISAHYDHLGTDPTIKGDQIFNGAADDGTGAVATLELADAFMRAKKDGYGPRRSILFINFTGEERGLLGSAYYTGREPVLPLAKTVANINMDGIGGFDPRHPAKSKNYIYIIGSPPLSQELQNINTRVNEVTSIKLELDYGKNYASDQFHFEKQFIPFIYYSTGLTEHYHRPSDHPETIAYDHMARVVRLILATAWQVANQAARPASIDRSLLTADGYVCPPCPYECDAAVYEQPGVCPVCGMNLVPDLKPKR